MANSAIDNNRNKTILGVSSIDLLTPTKIAVNPSTGAMLIDGTSLYTTLDTKYLKLDLSNAPLTGTSLTWNGDAARNITLNRNITTTGSSLTIQAGGSKLNGTDLNGGNLLLNSGISTGAGISSVRVQTYVPGTSGSSDQGLEVHSTFVRPSSTSYLLAVSNTTSGHLGHGISINGDANGTVGLVRNTTTTGSSFTVQAGGCTSGGTSLSGGQLILQPGISTGTGRSTVSIKGYTVNTVGATSDNTAIDSSVFGCNRALTNNSVIAIINATIASNTVCAGTIDYAVEVFNGTELQVEVGVVSYMCTNKGGVFSGNACVKAINQQNMTSGTLAVTFAITGANPAVVSVNANSSLTPSAGYPRLRYVINNLVGQSIAIQ